MINNDTRGNAVYETSSEAETSALGEKFASVILKNAKTGGEPLYISLTGEMGGGKTAFVKGIMRGLGYTGRVTSPTFALCNRYECGLIIYHIDLYRLSGEDDIYSAGILDLDDADAVLVEWAGIADGLMRFDINVGFEYGSSDNDRRLTFSNGAFTVGEKDGADDR